jgi:MYXO-CTERM domain-containing protein
VARKLAKPTSLIALVLVAASSATTVAAEPRVVQNPFYDPSPDAVVLDFAPDARNEFPLVNDAYRNLPATELTARPGLPEGLAQVGGMIVPEAMLQGADMVPDASLWLSAAGDPSNGGPDLNEICAFPEAVPPGVYDYDHRPGGETPRFHTVFLNFNGGVLMTGGENSAENMSGIAISGHPYPVYGGSEQTAIATAQGVQNDLADWAVRVVYEERPPKVLPYTMVMMGGSYSDTTAGPSGGVAPLDCEDFGQRNVCYVFMNGASSTGEANVASQEIGHTLGLGHTSASDSVMAAGYAPTQGGDLGYNDSCAPTIQVAGQSAACVGVNKCHCGDGEHQHDKNTLFVTFAPAGVDMVEPTIEITQPADGDVFEQGTDVIVMVDPWDDVGGYGWKLVLENEAGEILADSVDYERALEWKITGLEVGRYTLTALIQDHADHMVTHEIEIEVVEPVGGDTDTDTDTGGESGDASAEGEATAALEEGGDSEDGSDTEAESDSDSQGAGGDDSVEGCGCVTSPRSPAGAALLLLLAFVRRRRP